MKAERKITFGQLLDLIDPDKCGHVDIVLTDIATGDEKDSLSGRSSSPLWGAWKERLVACIGIADAEDFQVWLEEEAEGHDAE